MQSRNTASIFASNLILVAPMIWIQNQLVGAAEGHQESLECHAEAFPKSINYWTKFDGRIISQGKYAFLVNEGFRNMVQTS